MTLIRSLITAAAVWAAMSVSAHAEKRVALVIGNSAYKNVARLTNPVNDATAVANMFKAAGFDSVDSKLDATVAEMRRALREFGNRTREADIAVVYYAGHGIELDGSNYLIPTDATLEADSDVLDETIPLDRVLFAVDPAKQLRLVILDACRDNPFAKNMKRKNAARSIGRGLSKIEPSNPNTMIAFAARAGSIATDGDAANSPFATALINYLPKPGLDLRKAFGFVRDDVLKATNNAQEPFIYGSLGGNDVALVPADVTIAPAAPVASAPIDQDAPMRRDYELAERIDTRPAWDSFVNKYPKGFYTDLAKAQREKLVAEAARVEATNKAKAAQEEQTRLVNEGAKAVEQARLAERSAAAERARVVAEAKLAEADRAKAAAKAKLAERAKVVASIEPTRAPSESPANPKLSDGDGRCNRMHDKLGCLCALRNGGGVTLDGKRWYSKRGGRNAPTNEAFVQCQLRAGRGRTQ
jgi:uncharacterized caspase-like protein